MATADELSQIHRLQSCNDRIYNSESKEQENWRQKT